MIIIGFVTSALCSFLNRTNSLQNNVHAARTYRRAEKVDEYDMNPLKKSNDVCCDGFEYVPVCAMCLDQQRKCGPRALALRMLKLQKQQLDLMEFQYKLLGEIRAFRELLTHEEQLKFEKRKGRCFNSNFNAFD